MSQRPSTSGLPPNKANQIAAAVSANLKKNRHLQGSEANRHPKTLNPKLKAALESADYGDLGILDPYALTTDDGCRKYPVRIQTPLPIPDVTALPTLPSSKSKPSEIQNSKWIVKPPWVRDAEKTEDLTTPKVPMMEEDKMKEVLKWLEKMKTPTRASTPENFGSKKIGMVRRGDSKEQKPMVEDLTTKRTVNSRKDSKEVAQTMQCGKVNDPALLDFVNEKMKDYCSEQIAFGSNEVESMSQAVSRLQVDAKDSSAHFAQTMHITTPRVADREVKDIIVKVMDPTMLAFIAEKKDYQSACEKMREESRPSPTLQFSTHGSFGDTEYGTIVRNLFADVKNLDLATVAQKLFKAQEIQVQILKIREQGGSMEKYEKYMVEPNVLLRSHHHSSIDLWIKLFPDLRRQLQLEFEEEKVKENKIKDDKAPHASVPKDLLPSTSTPLRQRAPRSAKKVVSYKEEEYDEQMVSIKKRIFEEDESFVVEGSNDNDDEE